MTTRFRCVAAVLAILGTTAGDLCAQDIPADFVLKYHWQTGSLPPPYRYEYSIAIPASGAGRFVMMLDDARKWQADVVVPPTALRSLYASTMDLQASLVGNEHEACRKVLFRNHLVCAPIASALPSFGGERCEISVVAAGHEFRLPCTAGETLGQVETLPTGFEASRDAMVKAIRNLVPDGTWSHLEGEMFAYQKQLATQAQDRPFDAQHQFRLDYYWTSGGRASPGYYQYDLSINPFGDSRIFMVMGHPDLLGNATKWSEPLHPTRAQFDALMNAAGSETIMSRWRAGRPSDRTADEPSCHIQITAHYSGYSAPCNPDEVAPGAKAEQDELIRMIRAFVPDATWKKLDDERGAYLKGLAGK